MNSSLILSIDQGTTSSRAVVFDSAGQPVASAQQEFTQHFPKDGWVEHDANEIWQSVESTCRDALAQVDVKQVVTVGITNQRETTVVWDRRTGEPICHAIVWQDRRTADFCRQLEELGHRDLIAQKTGLLLDAYFSATKIRWILDNVKGARELSEQGHLAFGTVDSFLIFKLSNHTRHVTDVTNASRTMLFDIHNLKWDAELLDVFGIPANMLPDVLDCDDHFGDASALFDSAVSIHGVLGDQHAATVGQACFSPGMIKSTYGTGNFVMLNTGPVALTSKNQLLTTVAYRLNGKTTYALEGSVFIAGAVVQWLRDKLQVLDHAADSEAIAQALKESSNVVMVPAFTGLGAPHWDADARGAIFGLTRNTGYEHIVAAALESICLQSFDLLNAMRADGATISSLRVDGGMCANSWVMQLLADVLDLPVERPANIETTVLGAAAVAGLGAGILESQQQLTELWQLDQEFLPNMEADDRAAKIARWNDAIARVRLNH
ncbi:MAG: glycerol kinase GlpK [Gammaproteobacteria bacterium]